MTENFEKIKDEDYTNIIVNYYNSIFSEYMKEHPNIKTKKDLVKANNSIFSTLAEKIRDDFKKAKINKAEQEEIINNWLYIAVSPKGKEGLEALVSFLIKYLGADIHKKNKRDNTSPGELAVKRIEEGNGDIRMLTMLTEANDSTKKKSCLLI